MSGHTPGPWTVEDPMPATLSIMAPDRPGYVNEYRIVATVDTDVEVGILYQEAEANARLIAAAPELRASVREQYRLLCEWRRTPFFEDANAWQRWVDDFGARVDLACDSAMAAIAKAEAPQ